jgi:hypothetical protein
MWAASFRPSWLGLAPLAVLLAVALHGDAPRLEVTSESKWCAFGVLIAADGDLLVASDLSASDGWSPVLRIFDRGTEQARFEYRRGDWPIALAVSQGRVVVQLDTKRLDFYEQRRRGWTKVQSLELAGPCRQSFQYLDLGGDVVVIGADAAICVYERRDTRWVATAELPTVSVLDEPLTNGTRIGQRAVRPEEIVLSRRSAAGAWEVERRIGVTGDRRIDRFALTSRWLALTTSEYDGTDRAILIYELGSTVKLAHVLRPHAGDKLFGYWLAMTDDHLVASGYTHQLYSFDGRSWDGGRLLQPSRYPDYVALGHLAWIGWPGREPSVPGVIAGFGL